MTEQTPEQIADKCTQLGMRGLVEWAPVDCSWVSMILENFLSATEAWAARQEVRG